MTRDETKALLFEMTTVYPNFHPENLTATIDIWSKILEDDDPMVIHDAFIAYTRSNTSGFAPSPGQLRMMIADRVVEQTTDDDGQILNMLIMASRNASYGFEEEFAKMPPLLQKAVGSPTVIRSWGLIEQDELNYTFDRIVRTYKEYKNREKVNIATQGITPTLVENVTPLLKGEK